MTAPATTATSKTRKARKRADGEGTIRYSETKKLWIGWVMVGYRLDGKPDVQEVAAKRQDECKTKLDAIKTQARNGTLANAVTGRETVAGFLAAWLDAIDGTIEPGSLARHRDNVHRHIIPLVGRHKMRELRPEHLVAMLAKLRKQRPAPKLAGDKAPRAKRARKSQPAVLPPLAPRTVRYDYTTIRKAPAQAVEWGSVPRNVATLVKAPKLQSPEILSLALDEVAKFLDAVTESGDRMAPLYTVAVLSGCRLGELLALRWRDLNQKTGVVSINRTLVGTKDGVPTFADPQDTTLSPLVQASTRRPRSPQGAGGPSGVRVRDAEGGVP